MGPHAVAGLYSQISWHQNMRQVPTVGTTHGTDLAGRNRGLFWAMLLAMGVTYLFGTFTTVYMCYRKGGAMTMNRWIFQVSPRLPWIWASTNIAQPEGAVIGGYLWAGVGAVLMGLLVFAQRTFFWWPLHPVGVIMSTPHLVRVAWFPIMITWLTKVCILKFGGHRAYRKARSFAIGAVVGMFAAAGFWAVLDTLTGTVGNKILQI
jgi:hypothetical protein